ncbi:MAG: hypothetical protein ACK4TA_03340 [Saprospiraceae bacterium]
MAEKIQHFAGTPSSKIDSIGLRRTGYSIKIQAAKAFVGKSDVNKHEHGAVPAV